VTKTDTAEIAHVLYDALVGKAYGQLLAASEKLASIGKGDTSVQKHIEAALPPDTLPEVRNFILSLAQEGQLGTLKGVAQAFEAYCHVGAEAVSAEVISAVPLEAAQRERITADLRERYHQQLEPRFSIDETLIGGLVIRIGDQVFDNSLRTRLNVVQQGMLAS